MACPGREGLKQLNSPACLLGLWWGSDFPEMHDNIINVYPHSLDISVLTATAEPCRSSTIARKTSLSRDSLIGMS